MSKGRRSDVDANAFWAAAVALLPADLLKDRKGRAAMRLLDINYRVIKKGELGDLSLPSILIPRPSLFLLKVSPCLAGGAASQTAALVALNNSEPNAPMERGALQKRRTLHLARLFIGRILVLSAFTFLGIRQYPIYCNWPVSMRGVLLPWPMACHGAKLFMWEFGWGGFADLGAAGAALCVVAVRLPPLTAEVRQNRKGPCTRGVPE